MQTTFTLQPALAYKQRCEEVCQMELADIEASYVREQRILERLVERERLGYAELNDQHGDEKLDVGSIGMSFHDLHTLEQRIDSQLSKLSALARQADQKRAELIEIAKDKKALEKLKEKHDREVAKAIKRAESATMEEIATVQSHRRRSEQREQLADSR